MNPKTAAMVIASGILVLASLVYPYAVADASQSTAVVVPLVTVDSTGTLTIVSGTNPAKNHAIEFGTVPAGVSLNKSLVLAISANSGWTLQVSKNQDLRNSENGKVIASSNLKFTSSGPEGPTYVGSPIEFGEASPSTVAQYGEAISSASITVVYGLNIPNDQPAGLYSAHHTYTLVMP